MTQESKPSKNVIKTIPISELAYNAAKSMAASVNTSIKNKESIIETKDKRAERLKICLNCEHFGVEIQSGKRIIKYIGCGKCGCIATFKTMLKHESCPIDKW